MGRPCDKGESDVIASLIRWQKASRSWDGRISWHDPHSILTSCYFFYPIFLLFDLEPCSEKSRLVMIILFSCFMMPLLALLQNKTRRENIFTRNLNKIFADDFVSWCLIGNTCALVYKQHLMFKVLLLRDCRRRTLCFVTFALPNSHVKYWTRVRF